MRWFLHRASRLRVRDLEPVEEDSFRLPQPYEDIAQLQREYGNRAVVRWIEQRALIRRLTPGEQREQTGKRAESIKQVLAWARSSPQGLSDEEVAAETAENIARIFGLPDNERILARRYAVEMTTNGGDATLAKIECSKDFDDRVRTALQLVLRVMMRSMTWSK